MSAALHTPGQLCDACEGFCLVRRADPKLAALVRKLHGWELDHLRLVVEQQHQELEALRVENDQLRRDRDYADDCAESWRQDWFQLIEDTGATPGLTITGHLVALPPAESRVQ